MKGIKRNAGAIKRKADLKEKNKIIFYLVSVLILTIAVYSNIFDNYFITNYDDSIYLNEIEKVRQLTWPNIYTIFTTYISGNYHPLTILSLALDYHIYGLHHFPFHVENLILHLANIILVFRLIFLLSKRFEAAMIVSLFFAIHPMHVESVTWIVERKDVLYTFFYLGSLIAYLFYLKDDKKNKFLIYAFILFLLSLFSKPAAISLAPLLILIDYYSGRSFAGKAIFEKIPFFIVSIGFGVLTIFSQNSFNALSNISPDFSIIDRIFLISYSSMFYIVKLFYPFRLSAVYYYPELVNGKLPLVYYFAPLGIALIFFLIIKLKKIRHELIFGFIFYFITIALVVQFIPVGFAIAADRYAYVSYIGLFYIPAKLYCDYIDNKFRNFNKTLNHYIIFIIIIIAGLFSILSFERNKIWKDGVILFDNVIEQYPTTGHAYFARANGKYDKALYREALADYGCAIKFGYNHPIIYSNIGGCYFMMDSLDKAMNEFNAVIKMDSSFSMSYYGRAMVKQKLNDNKGAIEDYKNSIRHNYNIAQSYNGIGFILLNLKDLQGAMYNINLAIKNNPGFSIAYNNRGTAEYYMKDFTMALHDFNLSVYYDSTYSLAYFNRALVKFDMNNVNDGCADMNKAAKLGYPPAMAALNQYCNISR